MKTIGQIAYLILLECSSVEIEASLCNCVDTLCYKRYAITPEEHDLFIAVIAGWQAVGNGRMYDSCITFDGKSIQYIGRIQRIQEDFSIYIREDYEKKRQWLINLACMRS